MPTFRARVTWCPLSAWSTKGGNHIPTRIRESHRAQDEWVCDLRTSQSKERKLFQQAAKEHDWTAHSSLQVTRALGSKPLPTQQRLLHLLEVKRREKIAFETRKLNGTAKWQRHSPTEVEVSEFFIEKRNCEMKCSRLMQQWSLLDKTVHTQECRKETHLSLGFGVLYNLSGRGQYKAPYIQVINIALEFCLKNRVF